jgi:putative transposase
MTDYRRKRVPGATYFFTVNLLNRRSDLLRDAVRQTKLRAPFHIDACVILYQPAKTLTHRRAAFLLPPPCGLSRVGKRERGIWRRSSWEHTIRDEQRYAAHMDYIHFNSVKHDLASHVADWPHSSFHQAAAKGLYPSYWTRDGKDFGETGEACCDWG